MLLRLVLVIVIATALAGAAFAVVLRVEQDGSGDYLKIQDAVNVAASGDTILIGPGRYDDLQPRGVNNVVCVAFWDKGGALAFIGESADDVIIGPTTYAPDGTGPQGIHQRAPADIFVRNLTFTNLLSAIVGGDAMMRIEDSRFNTGKEGIFVQDPDSCIVRHCSFVDYPYQWPDLANAVAIYRAGYAEVVNCDFDNGSIYIGGAANTVIRDCVATGGKFISCVGAVGLIERCTAEGDIWAYDGGLLNIRNNVISGGEVNISVGGAETSIVVENNVLAAPTTYWNVAVYDDIGSFTAHENDIHAGMGNEYVVNVSPSYLPSGLRTLDMGGNYWGAHSNAAALDSLIYDGNDDPNIHVIVNYEPIRTESVPVEKKSLGGLKALFLGR